MQKVIVYQGQYDDTEIGDHPIFTRPLEDFTKTLEDGTKRFTPLESNKLFFITGNENKFSEAKQIIPQIEQLNIDLPEIQGNSQQIIEAKLQEAQKLANGNFFVEDVSLNIHCLEHLPGPYIKWFLKQIGPQGIYDLVKRYDNPKAEAIATIGISQNGKLTFVQGKITGKIVPPRGEGFGFDPIFMPEGHMVTFAQMAKEEKNEISHRRLALEELKKTIGQITPS